MIINSKLYSNEYALKDELEDVFYNNWIFFCFLSEFNNTNVINRKIGDLPIFLYKSENNLKGYFNICPHRGAILVNNNQYQGSSKTLLCPYHSWAFDLNTGSAKNVTNEELQNHNCSDLKSINVDTIGNFVFINISKNSVKTLSEYLTSNVVEELLLASEILDFSKISSKNIIHECNWKHIIENVIDNKHCGPVHKETLAKIGFCKNKPKSDLFENHSQFIIDPGSLEGANKRKRLLKMLYDEEKLVDYYKHILIFPNLTLSIFEGVHYTVGFVNPISNLKSNYETYYLRPFIKDENISNAIEASHVETAIDIFSEDVVMLNSLSDNLHKANFRGELYKDEIRINHFMQVYNKIINIHV
jgi:phenylpropionate dioxygenase-like ring-hydroxylating dioxygenase large terminal subunit